MNYKFKEDEILESVRNYIDSTYHKHYSDGKFQSTEVIFDAQHGEGFCVGNIMKYAQRYGKKNGIHNNNDLYKIIHYAIILLGQRIKDAEDIEYEHQMQIDMD